MLAALSASCEAYRCPALPSPLSAHLFHDWQAIGTRSMPASWRSQTAAAGTPSRPSPPMTPGASMPSVVSHLGWGGPYRAAWPMVLRGDVMALGLHRFHRSRGRETPACCWDGWRGGPPKPLGRGHGKAGFRPVATGERCEELPLPALKGAPTSFH